jgi:hypothetical protein
VYLFIAAVIVLLFTVPTLMFPESLNAKVSIVAFYDVGNTGGWDIITLNVTNPTSKPLYPIIIVYFNGIGKRWVISSNVTFMAPFFNVIAVRPHSWALINVSAPSPLYIIPPGALVYVQVYNMSTFDSVTSSVYRAPQEARPIIVNPCFTLRYYSDLYGSFVPWYWAIAITPGTRLFYLNNTLYVNGTAYLSQPTFLSNVNVSVIGVNSSVFFYRGMIIVMVKNGYVKCVEVKP